MHGAIHPPFVFMAWCLMKHMDNFVFLWNGKGEELTDLKSNHGETS
jgi:hypothetical protein